MKQETYRSTLVLIAVTLGAGFVLAIVFALTKPAIDQNTAKKLAEAQREVFSSADEYVERSTPDGDLYFDVLKNEIPIGRIYRVSSSGYGGPMEILVGIEGGTVTGVSVFAMLETPGFGDKIVKPEFINQFQGKVASDPVRVRKDIDAVMGATISSKALTEGVREALDLSQAGRTR